MKRQYEVVVSNTGIVFFGSNVTAARRVYTEYVEQSKANYGRAAGEAVVMFRDDDIYMEYVGTLQNNNY